MKNLLVRVEIEPGQKIKDTPTCLNDFEGDVDNSGIINIPCSHNTTRIYFIRDGPLSFCGIKFLGKIY